MVWLSWCFFLVLLALGFLAFVLFLLRGFCDFGFIVFLALIVFWSFDCRFFVVSWQYAAIIVQTTSKSFRKIEGQQEC